MSWDPLAPKIDLFSLSLTIEQRWKIYWRFLCLIFCQSSLFLRRLCFSCDKKLSQITQDLKKGTQYICICSIYKEYRDLLLIYLQIIFIFLLLKIKKEEANERKESKNTAMAKEGIKNKKMEHKNLWIFS